MGLLSLDHYSIRTADLETTRWFYVELLIPTATDCY